MSQSPAVFVIDDAEALHCALAAHLATLGIRSRSFFSAEEFLVACQPHWQGCLLVDLRMPGLDGAELLRELRRRGCAWPAILMAGHGAGELVQQAREAGAVAVLEKPFLVQDLRDLLLRECPALFR